MKKNDSVKNLNKAVSGVRTFHTWYQTQTGSKAWYRKSELTFWFQTLICNTIIQQLSRKTDKLWSKTCNGQLSPREMFYYFFALKKTFLSTSAISPLPLSIFKSQLTKKTKELHRLKTSDGLSCPSIRSHFFAPISKKFFEFWSSVFSIFLCLFSVVHYVFSFVSF